MKNKEIEKLQKWFHNYVSDFYTGEFEYDRNIEIKEAHTKRVCKNSTMIASKLGLPDKDILLAKIIALFHDVGRFRQYADYGTFKDADSENHAELGLQVLSEHNILAGLADKEKNILTKAIKFHNAMTLPPEEDDYALFFMKLIRDADKLDIWRVLIDYYKTNNHNPNSTLSLGLSVSEEYSNAILKSLYGSRIACLKDMKTLNDFKLLQISWVYDLNFMPSFQTVYENGFIKKISNTLPDTKEISDAVQCALDYVAKKVQF